MDNGRNHFNRNQKKKQSTFQNVMISLGCAACAGAYAIGGCYLLTAMAGNQGHGTLPAWMNKVEIRVSEETPSRTEGQAVPGNIQQQGDEPDQNDTYAEGIEQSPRFSTETQTDEESGETVAQSVTEKKEQETAAGNEESEKKDTSGEETDDAATDGETEEELMQTETPMTVVTDVTAVVKAAMPCVVSVTNNYTAYDYWYDAMVDDVISGSGIIVSQSEEELLIVTNYHVIEDNNDLHVQFIDEEEATAYVKGTSPEKDLAVIAVFLEDLPDETLEDIAIASLGDSDLLQVGEPAIAIGNALGYGQSVTTGVISALNRTVYMIDEEYMDTDDEASVSMQECLIQTDAAINPGNSGGALLNIRGEVIGINSSKNADYAVEGVGYAIPISTAKPIIDELMQEETKKKLPQDERGFLGIAGNDVSEEAMEKYDMPEGVFVSKVLEDTAARKAGILKGDIITCIDGEKVTQMQALQNLLEYYAAGTKIEVTFMRQSKGEYKEMTVNVTLKHKDE